ncbi:MAG: hypothetical protein D3916_06495 [Candidatus Electrothrix sp. MAN1_4]|nr:hypothetical protein [Candidatus Electrothrix sp. MAN1_4]
MKLNKIIRAIALLVSINPLFAFAGVENGTQETSVEQEKSVQKAQVVTFPDYNIGLFSHKAHMNGTGLQCTDCHNKIFEMSASNVKAIGDFHRISFGEGKYCGACHNGSVAFGIQDEASCSRCHGNDVNPPNTILFEKPLKAVLFDHALHHKELGLACNECHMKLFDMKMGSAGEKGDFTMQAMYDGKYCGACHNGSLAFDLKENCSKCHVMP